MQSQLSSSELLSITRDTTAFFGRQPSKRFRSASEAQAYRKMLTIASGVNGPSPVSSVITTLQTVAECRRPLLSIIEDAPVEDLSVQIRPVPAVPERIAREARLNAMWELHKYGLPVPKKIATTGFGGSGGSGNIALGLSEPATVTPFSQLNPMRVGGQRA